MSLVYYGVSYGSVDLGWNPYLTFALTGVIEFPSNFGAVWAADRYSVKCYVRDHIRSFSTSTVYGIS